MKPFLRAARFETKKLEPSTKRESKRTQTSRCRLPDFRDDPRTRGHRTTRLSTNANQLQRDVGLPFAFSFSVDWRSRSAVIQPSMHLPRRSDAFSASRYGSGRQDTQPMLTTLFPRCLPANPSSLSPFSRSSRVLHSHPVSETYNGVINLFETMMVMQCD